MVLFVSFHFIIYVVLSSPCIILLEDRNYKHCHNYIQYNMIEITNTTYIKYAPRLIIAVWLCLLLFIYLHTVNYIIVSIHSYSLQCHCTMELYFSWWHIQYFLLLDFYPIEGTAIFHSDQLHAAVCSPKFNFIF